MAIALVQHKSTFGNGTASPLGLTFTGSNAAGNLLVAICGGPSSTTHSVTDTNTNTWSAGPTITSVSNGQLTIFYAANCKAGASTVNFAWTGGATSDPHLHVYEYSGVATSTPLDASGASQKTVAATSQSQATSGAITNGNDVVIAAFLDWAAANTFSAGTNFVLQDTSNNSTGGDSMGSEDRILSGAALAIQTVPITLTTSGVGTIAVACFLPVSAGGTVNHFLSCLGAGA